MKYGAWLVGLLLLLAGCTNASRSEPTPPATLPSPASTTQKAPSSWQKGIHIYWIDNPDDSTDVVRAKARRVLDYIVQLKANAVAISFPIYTDGPISNQVFAKETTPSPERLGIIIQEAQLRNLRTTIRPLLDELSLKEQGEWRGSIAPTDHLQWFGWYERLLQHYAVLAERMSVDSFAIGAELGSMENSSVLWEALIRRIRASYHGELEYSSNWDTFAKRHTPIDVKIGLDIYFPVELDDDATVDQIVAAWNKWFDAVPRKVDFKQLVVHEVGIAAQPGVYRQPSHWGDWKQPLNLTVQKNWFEAACTVVKQRRMAGVYWWKYDFHVDPANVTEHDLKDRGLFVQRPAADAIKKCFS